MRFIADIFSTSIFFGCKMPPNRFPMVPFVTNLKWCFVRHCRAKMDAVYNRHVLGPKTTLNLFFSFAKRKYPRNGWYVAKTFSVLNVESLFIVATKCPPNRYLLLCQSCSFLFLFVWHHARKMDAFLCEGRCQLWFSVGYNALEMDVFFVACSMWHPCLVESKCIPQGCLSRQMVSMHHFFFTGKCPQNGCLLWQWFSMCHCKMPPTWTSLKTQVVNVKPCKALFWLGQSPPDPGCL